MIKKTLVLALVSVMILLAVAPALAATSKEISVTFTRQGPFANMGDNRWYTDGDTYHIRDGILGFQTYSITGQDVAYSGSTSSTLAGNLNLKTKEGVMTFKSTVEFADGTFEGVITQKGTFNVLPGTYPVVTLRGYMVPIDAHFIAIWHGTGAYIGQTLKLEYYIVGGVTPSPLVGTLLIP